MIWFLERNADLLICEIRHARGGDDYEFEITPSRGPSATARFASPRELIEGYLTAQSRLRAKGWRPHLGEISL